VLKNSHGLLGLGFYLNAKLGLNQLQLELFVGRC